MPVVKRFLIDSMLWTGLIWDRGMLLRTAMCWVYGDYLHTWPSVFVKPCGTRGICAIPICRVELTEVTLGQSGLLTLQTIAHWTVPSVVRARDVVQTELPRGCKQKRQDTKPASQRMMGCQPSLRAASVTPASWQLEHSFHASTFLDRYSRTFLDYSYKFSMCLVAD